MKRAGRWFVLLVVRLAEHEGLADASAGAGELDEASVVDFGRLKNEFFYGRDWRGVGYEEFRERLSTYLTHLQ